MTTGHQSAASATIPTAGVAKGTSPAAATAPTADAPPTRDTAYLAALTTYVHSLPLPSSGPATTGAPTADSLLTLAAHAGYQAPDADVLADLAHVAALTPDPDVLDTTYQLAFAPSLPATAYPGAMYLLLTLGFQVDDYAVVLGSYCVDVKFRGLVKQVVGEITDAPAATALLGGYRETPPGQEESTEENETDEDQDAAAAKVHEHDRLYHVEMDVSEEAWRWSWERVKQIPGLATFMQV